MSPVLDPSRIAGVVRLLPAWLLRALDAWSHEVAKRRAQQRQRKWLERKAASGL